MEIPEKIRAFRPEIGIILGSGLGSFVEDRLEVADQLAYASIKGFPVSTVPGHAGRFVCGRLGGRRILCMQGRFHYYEGYSLQQVTQPVRLMHAAGVQTLLATNAAGGIHPDYQPGDFMLLRDHINFLGSNPLIGDRTQTGTRFPDLSEVYDADLRARLRAWSAEVSLALHEGVYLATTGPSFETPAEIRAFRQLGADAVGMSTVPEAIVAKKLGMRMLGISCITNAAAGLSAEPLTHEEVGDTAARVRDSFADLLESAVSFCEEPL